jgi:hypothetical protein
MIEPDIPKEPGRNAMDVTRWAAIQSLYHAALEKEAGERSSFLAAACAERKQQTIRIPDTVNLLADLPEADFICSVAQAILLRS